MQTILVVEDETAIARVLKVYLQKAGYKVAAAADGSEALNIFFQMNPALVLLDVMLPTLDGWSILKRIRKQSACPVIMLTALDEVNYRLAGLNDGADDYITKPFVADEVVARVNAVLRRSFPEKQDILAFGNLKIDVSAHKITIDEQEIILTPRDLSLLLFLAKHPNQTFTREQLIEHVWGIDYDGSDRAVDLSIKRLRKAIKDWKSSAGEIKTLRGLGYQFCVTKNW
ncbi:response regulator transcription factor [Bacillaceae bacterium Marseille-Q3522]|nr:response regulator transcription factor [Bacillaceae bacterium Marseille-Q3522]